MASTEIMPRQRCHNQIMKDAAARLGARARQVGPAPRAAAVRMAAPARLAAVLAGAAAAAGALAVAEGPGRATTYAGSSAAGAALTLSAGLILIAAALIVCLGPGPRRTGDLALLAGVAWFAPVWAAWQDGPPLVPSLAIVAGGFTFPLVVHLVLAYPSGQVGSTPARVLVAAVYAEAVLATAILALFRDPYLDPGCLANCNVNVFLVHAVPSLARARPDRRPLVRGSGRGRAHRVLCGAAGGGLRAGPEQARSGDGPCGPARRRGGGAGGRAAVDDGRGSLQPRPVRDLRRRQRRGYRPGCWPDLRGHACPGGAPGYRPDRGRPERGALPGTLQSALAQALHDPELRIAYWLPGAQRYGDAPGGQCRNPWPGPGGTVTA